MINNYIMFHRVMIISLTILNKNMVQWHLYHKKLLLQSLQISATFNFNFFLNCYLYWGAINHKFCLSVLGFKLFHSYSWMRIIMTCHCLSVQTHHNIFRSTFFNFFGKCEEIQNKLHTIVLTLFQWVLAGLVGHKPFFD